MNLRCTILLQIFASKMNEVELANFRLTIGLSKKEFPVRSSTYQYRSREILLARGTAENRHETQCSFRPTSPLPFLESTLHSGLSR